MAACHGAFDVLRVLIEHTSEVNFTNRQGGNVVHDMINLSAKNPQDEQEYVEHFNTLCGLMATEKVRNWLRGESKILPIEWTCFQETFVFAKAVLGQRGGPWNEPSSMVRLF